MADAAPYAPYSRTSAGARTYYDSAGNAIFTIDGVNRRMTFASGAGLQLPANSRAGVIPIGIFNTRLLSANAFLNTIEAGTPDGNTSPSLSRVNGATDKMARLAWAAAAVDEVQLPSIVYPPDLDDTAAITVCVLAAMAGATDTPTISVGFFEGVGDTDAGGATAAVTGTTIAKYTRAIAAADVGAYPKAAAITLTPGAHGTDALYVYGAWVEYTRLLT